MAGAEEAGNVTALLGDAFYTCDQAGPDGDLPNSVTRGPSYASGDEFPGAGLAYFVPGNGKSDDPSVRPYLAGSGHGPVKGATSFVIDGTSASRSPRTAATPSSSTPSRSRAGR